MSLRAYTVGIVVGIAFTIAIVCLIAATAEPDYVLVRIPRDQLQPPQKPRGKLASVTPIRRELEQPAASSAGEPPPEASS